MTNQDDVNIAAENINNNQLTLTRRIRSFVLRQGRLTKGQEQALMTLWPKYGIEYSATSPIAFAQENPIVLEIGFGMGASFIEMAASAKDKHFLGIEVHKPGVGACLMAIDERKLTNVNVMCHDAVEVLENSIMDNALDHVQIFFPDPWHKARHHKRRIIQPQFVKLVMQKLKSGGTLHLATDWQPYAEHMLTVLSETSGLQNVSKTGDYIPRPDTRPMTKFENRGQKLGHGVWDLQFMKLPNCK